MLQNKKLIQYSIGKCSLFWIVQGTKVDGGINASTKKPKGMKHILVVPTSPHGPKGRVIWIFILSSSPSTPLPPPLPPPPPLPSLVNFIPLLHFQLLFHLPLHLQLILFHLLSPPPLVVTMQKKSITFAEDVVPHPP
jgi:hypothetical protein